jgi:RNA polymerase sigma factor (sigma-70 family)
MSTAVLARLRPRPVRPAASWTDAELVDRCLRGDDRAWSELVDRYGRLVYSIARRYGLDGSDAGDLFQEVFTILYRKLSTVRDASRLSSWIISTTMRECRRLGRRSRRCEPLQEAPDSGCTAAEENVLWERRQLVRQALRQLGGPCERLLIALFSCPGPPHYPTIAQQLGIRTGSIGPTRARCFRKLEKILVELGLDEACVTGR